MMITKAGSFTWTGSGDATKWTDPANWGGSGYPNGGDTAQFNGDATSINEDFALTSGVLTISVAKDKNVYLRGVISGEGGIKKIGAGKLHMRNDANTYSGTTECNGGELWFVSIANIGEPSSVGAPTAENAQLRLTGGVFYMENQSNASRVFTTDRPVHFANITFRLPFQPVTVNINGPITGTSVSWRGQGIVNLAQYVPSTFTGFGRTDSGRLNLLCPTNAFHTTGARTASLSDGTFCGTIADKGVPCGLGAGMKFQFGQQNYATTGGIVYNGLTNTNCNRDLQIEAYTNGNYTTANHGGILRNDSPGTCITFNGTLRINGNNRYVHKNAPFIWLTGDGDGVLEPALPDNLSLRKEMSGTWTLTGASTSTGIVQVIAGRLNVDGSICATTGYTAEKVTVSKNAVLGGTGTVHSTALIMGGGIVAPGHSNLIGTLNFGVGKLSFDASSIINLKFGAEGHDKVVADGVVITKGMVTINLQPQGNEQIAPGVYELITAGSFTTSSFVLGTGAPEGAQLLIDAARVRLFVPNASMRTITWTGAQSANWDESAENWTVAGEATTFASGDAVRFDDSSEVNNVTIPSSVEPSSVTVASDQANYVFDGDGSIASNGSLTKEGASTLTLKGTHSFGFGARVDAGKLQLDGTLNGTSIKVADNAVLDQKETGVISGDNLLLDFGYGNNYLRGINTFTGRVNVDMRGHSGTGDVSLHLYGEKPLGNATSVSMLGFGKSYSECANLEVHPGALAENVTFIFAGDGAGGKRVYLRGSNSSDQRAARWYGNVEIESGGQPYIQSYCPNFEIGRPNGTNTITGNASFNFRGHGTIYVHSRINISNQSIGRDDTGITVLYATNNVFNDSAIVQGFVHLGAHNAWCTNAAIAIGKNNNSAKSGFNLNGFDQTFPALNESNLSFANVNCTRRIWTPDGKPATLTISGAKDCIWGSSYGYSYMQGPLSLTKTGAKKFTLNGTNAFTGTTTIEAGRLEANVLNSLGGTTNVTMKGGTLYLGASKALNESADVCFPADSAGVIELADGVEQPVQYLYINRSDNPCRSGTYGSSQSAAANKDDVHFAGTGVLVVRRGGGFVMFIR